MKISNGVKKNHFIVIAIIIILIIGGIVYFSFLLKEKVKFKGGEFKTGEGIIEEVFSLSGMVSSVDIENNFLMVKPAGAENEIKVILSDATQLIRLEYQEEKKEKEFELKALKKDWRVDETPEFEVVPKGEKAQENIIENLVAKVSPVFEEEPKIEAKLDSPQNQELELQEGEDFKAETHSPTKITVFKPKDFRPGLHKLKIDFEKNGKTYNLEEDFTWGVLAINVNKSIYLSNEEVYLQMAALRDDGYTICDANLKLEITTHTFNSLEVAFPEVQKSGECGPNNVTDVPDYFAYYQVGEPGIYQMILTQMDTDGNTELHRIEDSFEVRESVPFDVERIGPTRIYPLATYEMTLRIRVNQDFQGQVVEQVPASFEIISPESTQIGTQINTKEIVWQADWKTGESYELSYQFDAPDISPYLYLLGPLVFTESSSPKAIFQEIRKWQIAADATGGQMTLYLQRENSDSNPTYNALTLTQPSPTVATVSGTVNFPVSTYPPPCESVETTGNTFTTIPVDDDEGQSLGSYCLATFISLPVGQSISISTADTNSLYWEIYGSNGTGDNANTSFNFYLYKFDGTSYTLFGKLTVGDLETGAQTNVKLTATVTPYANVTLAAGNRIYAVLYLGLIAGDTSTGNDTTSVLFGTTFSPAFVKLSYTVITPNKPDLAGARDDDFTTALPTTDCTNAGITYNTKWTCTTPTGTTLGTVSADASGGANSSQWLILRDKDDATLGTNFSTSPENTYIYQTVDTNADGSGAISTVVNSTNNATAGTSPYYHGGLLLWASNTDYLIIEAMFDGTNRGVAINDDGVISNSTAISLYNRIWLRWLKILTNYQAQYSTDGSNWTNLGTVIAHATTFTRAGLNSYAATKSTGYAAAFEWFDYALAAVAIDQTHYRWRNDNGSEGAGGAGTLDTAWDGDGVVAWNSGGAVWDQALASAFDSANNKLYAAGGPTTLRYNSDGTLDTAWSDDGVATWGSDGFGATALAFDSVNNKLYVAGTAGDAYVDLYFEILRYNSNGTLDTAWSGDGVATWNSGDTGVWDQLAALAFDSANNKLYVTGAGYAARSYVTLRYNSNGTLDNTWDGDGVATWDSGNGDPYHADLPSALSFDSANNKLYVVGSSGVLYTNMYFATLRYNSNGTLDNTWSDDGVAIWDSAGATDASYASAFDSANNKLYVAGYTKMYGEVDYVTLRYNSDGTIDNTWSGDGIAIWDSPWDDSNGASDLAFDSVNNKLYVAGVINTGYAVSYANFATLRYNSNGTLDNTWSGDGYDTWTSGGAHTTDSARALSFNSANNKLYVVGYLYPGAGNGYDFAILRYHTEVGATWKQLEDTPHTNQAKYENIRVRFSIKNTGGAASYNYRLQVGLLVGADCDTDETYTDVPVAGSCGSAVACMADSSWLAGSPEASQDSTGRQLSIPGGFTFVAGRMVDNAANQTAAIILQQNTFTEVEYNFQFTTNAISNTTYCLRTSNAGTALNSYTKVAKITIFGPSCSVLSYPATEWQRVWYDINGNCLGNGPNEPNEEFNNDWGSGVLAYTLSDNIMFYSSKTISIPSTASYKFILGSDDGSRLYIDGSLKIDLWSDHGYTEKSTIMNLTAGNHQFRIDYYERTGGARVSFDILSGGADVDCYNECVRRGYATGDCYKRNDFIEYHPCKETYSDYDPIGSYGSCSPNFIYNCECCHNCPTAPVNNSVSVGTCTVTITGTGNDVTNPSYVPGFHIFNKDTSWRGYHMDEDRSDPGWCGDRSCLLIAHCFTGLYVKHSWTTAADQITILTEMGDKNTDDDLGIGFNFGSGCKFTSVSADASTPALLLQTGTDSEQGSCLTGPKFYGVKRSAYAGGWVSWTLDLEYCGDGETNCGERCDWSNPNDPNKAVCESDCSKIKSCLIGGTPYNNGDYNPTNKCQVCDITKSTTAWSNIADGTDPQNWCSVTWNSCDSACVKRGGNGNCYAGACDTNRGTGYISTSGLVCSGGSEVAPTPGNNCDATIDCSTNACSAGTWYRGCTAGATTCVDTGKVAGTAWSATDGSVINETASGKVAASCTQAVPTASLYCSTALVNNNNCQYTTYYRACGGGGSCRTDNTGAASAQTTCGANQATVGATSCTAVTISNYCGTGCNGSCQLGYYGCVGSGSTCEAVFRAYSNCGAGTACSGSTCASGNYCATNQCRDGGGWHHKCSKWCDNANGCNNWADATCVDHCTNKVKDCDETGTDCGGSCPSCDITPPTVDIRIFDSTNIDVTEIKSWLKADTYTIKFKAKDDESGSNNYEYYIYKCPGGSCDYANPIDHVTGDYAGEVGIEVIKTHLMEAGKSPKKYNLEGAGAYLIKFLATDKAGKTGSKDRGVNFDFTPPWTEIR